MSLLDNGRDRVVAYYEIDGHDSLGNPIRKVDEDNPHVLYGRMQPSASTEPTDQTVATTYIFRSREFRGSAIARLEWDGRVWDLVGDPMRRNGSDFTRHVTITVRARTSERI